MEVLSKEGKHMKSMKKITGALLALTMAVSFAACSGGTGTQTTVPKSTEPVTFSSTQAVKVATLKGPTGMGAVKLMEDNATGKTAIKYDFGDGPAAAPDAVTAMLLSGEVDIAAVPTNVAVSLYNKTKGKIQIAAANTLGVLYVLQKGDAVKSVADLKGKTVYASGQGATPEYVLNYILKQNGLTAGKDVKIVWEQDHATLAAKAAAGKVELALLPEPNVTSTLMQGKEQGLSIALNLTDEWNKAVAKTNGDSKLIMGCVVVRTDYAKAHADVVNEFLKEYKASIDYVNSNAEEASALVEKYQIMPKAALAKQAIPKCNIVYIAGSEMKKAITPFYQVLFDADAKSIGGAMPNDDFYYGANQ